MGSIPLPALHVNPPADPSEGMQRILAMKGMMQQQQLVNAEVQQRQQQVADTKASTAALAQWDGKDPNDIQKLVLKHGGSSTAALSTSKLLVQQKGEAIDLVAKQGTEAKRQADLVVGAGDLIDKAKPEERPAAWSQAIQGLHAQGVDTSKFPQQYPGDQGFKALFNVVRAHSQNVEDALKAADTAKATAQAGEATAQTNKINTEINPDNPADPNIRKQKYEGILQKIQQNGLSGVTPQEMQFARAFEFGQQKTTTQSDSLGVASTNISTPSGISGAVAASRKNAPAQGAALAVGGAPAKPAVGGLTKLTPAQAKEGIVDMIGNYRFGLGEMARAMAKHPELPALVGAKYPDWDQTTYNAKNKLITGYTSGPQSKEINAINTAMGHIKNLDDAVDALHNGDMTILNKIGKAYNINVGGKTAEAAFQLIVHRVGPEIASAYIPGGGGVAERMADEKDFDVNLPPQTLHNNAAVTVNMLRSKIGALENQYKNAVGRDDFAKRFITPEAQASLQKFSPQSSSGPAKAGGFDFNKFPNVHP